MRNQKRCLAGFAIGSLMTLLAPCMANVATILSRQFIASLIYYIVDQLKVYNQIITLSIT